MKKIITLWLLLTTFASYAERKQELIIKKIAPNVFSHQSFKQVDGYGLVGSNGLIVIDSNNAFIIDTPWTNQDTEKLVTWIIANGYKPVGSLSTHSHQDRSGGVEWLNTHFIPTYASKRTNQILKENKKPQATQTFPDSLLKLHNNQIEVFYPGGGHTIDNIVVWLPESELLFGGCFVKSLHSKSLGYTGEAHINAWPNAIDNVISTFPNIKVVVPGHGKSGDISLLSHTKTLAIIKQTKSNN